MPLSRRFSAPYRGNLYSPAQTPIGQGTWAYNSHYNYAPQPQPAFPQPLPSPTQRPAPSPHAVISPEDDVQRLFNVCKVGRNNAELLQEVLVYANPQELRNDITKDLLARARASHDLISSQIPWATTEAEKSQRTSYAEGETIQEQLLAALLGAHEQLTECLKMHEDLDRVAIEQEAMERMKTERLIKALTAVSEYKPSPDEAPLIDQVFSIGDPERTGKVNPQTATRIFSASNLSPDALARIWEIASVDSKDGLLDRQGVGVALRLIGHAQCGEKVDEGLVRNPGALAVLENISTEPLAGPSSGVSLASLPPLTSQDKAKFKKIFKDAAAQNGFLSAQQAKDVFMKSRLPWSTLSEVWNLADVRSRGYLDVADFTVAMYLIQALMTGKINGVPTSLPQHLYDEAAQQTPSTSPLPPPPPIHPSRAAQSPFAGSPTAPTPAPIPPPRHPSSRTQASTPTPALSRPLDPMWIVSPATKVVADHVFSTLDPRKKGRAKGEAVRSYMHQAGLSTSAAGRVWDLVDIDRKGYLTRDKFALAMHLVKMRKDGHQIPSSLPPGLLQDPSTESNNTAYTGNGGNTQDYLDPDGHVRSQSQSPGSSTTAPGPPHLRLSRSTSNIPSLIPQAAVSPIPSSSATPFPMSPLPGSTSSSYFPAEPTSIAQWNIKPEDRARYDSYFDHMDTSRKGFLLSDVAVPFFAKAKLPQDVMAVIWDLADSEHDGQLTRDDFAIAMHLIRQKLAGKELPTNLTSLASQTPSSAQPERAIRRDSGPQSRRPTPTPRTSTGSQHQLDPATVRLPDDVEEDVRSDTPPPPYELLAPEA